MAQPTWAEKKRKMRSEKRDLINRKEIFIFPIILSVGQPLVLPVQLDCIGISFFILPPHPRPLPRLRGRGGGGGGLTCFFPGGKEIMDFHFIEEKRSGRT